jgi:transcriptional regulator with XRE-family HTH domain
VKLLNIGKKIQTLRESMGFKNYQEFGKAIGLPGDWLQELSKRDSITNIDITRLIKIADYFNISVDWLLQDTTEQSVNIGEGLPDDDIGKMLDNIQKQLESGANKFNGYIMNNEVIKLSIDAIDEIKKIIKENL